MATRTSSCNCGKLSLTYDGPDPERGWFTILRCYSPLASFFDKTWRAGEIEPV